VVTVTELCASCTEFGQHHHNLPWFVASKIQEWGFLFRLFFVRTALFRAKVAAGQLLEIGNEVFVTARPSSKRALADEVDYPSIYLAVQPFTPSFNGPRLIQIEERVGFPVAMGSDAGPAILGCGCNDSGAHRIILDVPNRIPCMSLTQDAGKTAFLPKMTDITVLLVKPLGVHPMAR